MGRQLEGPEKLRANRISGLACIADGPRLSPPPHHLKGSPREEEVKDPRNLSSTALIRRRRQAADALTPGKGNFR